MKLYIVSIDGIHVSWDMFDSFLVAAETPEQAINLAIWAANECDPYFKQYDPTATEVGSALATEAKVLMSSFNAG